MAPTGVTESDACISNTRADKELSLVCLSISPPKLPVVLVWSIFADPLPFKVSWILHGFLWQRLLRAAICNFHLGPCKIENRKLPNFVTIKVFPNHLYKYKFQLISVNILPLRRLYHSDGSEAIKNDLKVSLKTTARLELWRQEYQYQSHVV